MQEHNKANQETNKYVIFMNYDHTTQILTKLFNKKT